MFLCLSFEFGYFSGNSIRRSLCSTRSTKLQDDLTEVEREEIDRAIAISLSEDPEGKNVIGKIIL